MYYATSCVPKKHAKSHYNREPIRMKNVSRLQGPENRNWFRVPSRGWARFSASAFRIYSALFSARRDFAAAEVR
jgi:hypothetical protein